MATIYLYWQWYHYTRQSEGISKAYGAKSRHLYTGPTATTRAIFYLVPLAGIVTVSARSPETFLFMPIWTLPIPSSVSLALNAIALAAIAWWVVDQCLAYRRGEFALPWALYMSSHFLIYSTAYIWIENINYGWLVINIWHNAQYILFVWLYNNRRFSGELDTKHLFLSTISKNKNIALYLGVCFAISTLAYFLLTSYGEALVVDTLGVSSLAAAMIIYQTINFHHYIVDATIWKLRKKPIRENLGIS